MTTILKLGGSVVTDKDRPETLDERALADLAAAIGDRERGGDLVIVHGGGSFGHHHAADRGVTRTTGTRDATAVTAIHDAMDRLNERIVDALQARGVPAVPVHPLSSGYRDEAGDLVLASAVVERLLAEGFTPVTHGDVLADAGAGATIVSGDELVVEFARDLGADRVGLCSTVPGVLDDDGAVIPTVDAFESVADVLEGSESTDVTGGMAGKVRTLLALDAPAVVFGPGDVDAFLAGESPGTTIRGGDGATG